MMRKLARLSLCAVLALAGCGPAEQVEEEEEPAPAAAALQAADFPALGSSSCVDVAQFYFEAVSGGEFDRAALAWDDPVIDGARLKALFDGYPQPEITWGDPVEANGEGAQLCSILGVLTDAADKTMPAREGALVLSRASGEGSVAAPWRVESSSFIEELRRSGRN